MIKSLVLLALLSSVGPTLPTDPSPIDKGEIELPKLPSPPPRPPYTLAGARLELEIARQVCRGQDFSYCKKAAGTGNTTDVYEKATNKYLFSYNRIAAELIQQDYAKNMNDAEEQHPESKYIARREAEKSDLEYISVACASSFGTFCGGYAAKVGKYGLIIAAGCSVALQTCEKAIRDKQNEIQKEIDRVKAACAAGDQQCFDAITGGGETQAQAQSKQEKSQGDRPPHTPSGGWAPGRPLDMSSPGHWEPAKYDPSCDSCTISEWDAKAAG